MSVIAFGMAIVILIGKCIQCPLESMNAFFLGGGKGKERLELPEIFCQFYNFHLLNSVKCLGMVWSFEGVVV